MKMKIVFFIVLITLFQTDLKSSDLLNEIERFSIPIKNIHKNKSRINFLNDEYWDDERIKFSTYFGGSGIDIINDAAVDSEGNIIQVGYTGSPDLPMVGNSFQKTKNNNLDMFIVKWNPEGDVIWSTFLGGVDEDVLYNVAIDSNDDIIVSGRTESFDIIVSPDAAQYEYQGKSDYYLAKFSKDGNYIWSTYWGGSGEEFNTHMVLDKDDNIYFAGNTTSQLLPTKNDAFQRTLDKIHKENAQPFIKQGVYISKFNNDGKHTWGTYFSTGTDYRDFNGFKQSYCLNEVLTSMDVFEDEIALSWNIEKYAEVFPEPKPEFYLITDDAEQKEGVFSERQQAQVFKIDTSGTKQIYGTFYSGESSSSLKIKYDINGNLICLFGTIRKNNPYPNYFNIKNNEGWGKFIMFNNSNQLAWEQSFGCEGESGSADDFDLDEKGGIYFYSNTNCKGYNLGNNNFKSELIERGRITGLIFYLNYLNYSMWASYIDLFAYHVTSVNIGKTNIYFSGYNEIFRTKNAYQDSSKNDNSYSGLFIKIDFADVVNKINNSKFKINNYIINSNKLLFNSSDSINNVVIYNSIGQIVYINSFFSESIEIELNICQGTYYLVNNNQLKFRFLKLF
jgi:hypothetical protein